MDLVRRSATPGGLRTRRAVNPGNSYSFSLDFFPKVKAHFQNCGVTLKILVKLVKCSKEMFKVVQERRCRIKKI